MDECPLLQSLFHPFYHSYPFYLFHPFYHSYPFYLFHPFYPSYPFYLFHPSYPFGGTTDLPTAASRTIARICLSLFFPFLSGCHWRNQYIEKPCDNLHTKVT